MSPIANRPAFYCQQSFRKTGRTGQNPRCRRAVRSAAAGPDPTVCPGEQRQFERLRHRICRTTTGDGPGQARRTRYRPPDPARPGALRSSRREIPAGAASCGTICAPGTCRRFRRGAFPSALRSMPPIMSKADRALPRAADRSAGNWPRSVSAACSRRAAPAAR